MKKSFTKCIPLSLESAFVVVIVVNKLIGISILYGHQDIGWYVTTVSTSIVVIKIHQIIHGEWIKSVWYAVIGQGAGYQKIGRIGQTLVGIVAHMLVIDIHSRGKGFRLSSLRPRGLSMK